MADQVQVGRSPLGKGGGKEICCLNTDDFQNNAVLATVNSKSSGNYKSGSGTKKNIISKTLSDKKSYLNKKVGVKNLNNYNYNISQQYAPSSSTSLDNTEVTYQQQENSTTHVSHEVLGQAAVPKFALPTVDNPQVLPKTVQPVKLLVTLSKPPAGTSISTCVNGHGHGDNFFHGDEAAACVEPVLDLPKDDDNELAESATMPEEPLAEKDLTVAEMSVNPGDSEGDDCPEEATEFVNTDASEVENDQEESSLSAETVYISANSNSLPPTPVDYRGSALQLHTSDFMSRPILGPLCVQVEKGNSLVVGQFWALRSRPKSATCVCVKLIVVYQGTLYWVSGFVCLSDDGSILWWFVSVFFWKLSVHPEKHISSKALSSFVSSTCGDVPYVAELACLRLQSALNPTELSFPCILIDMNKTIEYQIMASGALAEPNCDLAKPSCFNEQSRKISVSHHMEVFFTYQLSKPESAPSAIYTTTSVLCHNDDLPPLSTSLVHVPILPRNQKVWSNFMANLSKLVRSAVMMGALKHVQSGLIGVVQYGCLVWKTTFELEKPALSIAVDVKTADDNAETTSLTGISSMPGDLMSSNATVNAATCKISNLVYNPLLDAGFVSSLGCRNGVLLSRSSCPRRAMSHAGSLQHLPVRPRTLPLPIKCSSTTECFAPAIHDSLCVHILQDIVHLFQAHKECLKVQGLIFLQCARLHQDYLYLVSGCIVLAGETSRSVLILTWFIQVLHKNRLPLCANTSGSVSNLIPAPLNWNFEALLVPLNWNFKSPLTKLRKINLDEDTINRCQSSSAPMQAVNGVTHFVAGWLVMKEKIMKYLLSILVNVMEVTKYQPFPSLKISTNETLSTIKYATEVFNCNGFLELKSVPSAVCHANQCTSPFTCCTHVMSNVTRYLSTRPQEFSPDQTASIANFSVPSVPVTPQFEPIHQNLTVQRILLIHFVKCLDSQQCDFVLQIMHSSLLDCCYPAQKQSHSAMVYQQCHWSNTEVTLFLSLVHSPHQLFRLFSRVVKVYGGGVSTAAMSKSTCSFFAGQELISSPNEDLQMFNCLDARQKLATDQVTLVYAVGCGFMGYSDFLKVTLVAHSGFACRASQLTFSSSVEYRVIQERMVGKLENPVSVLKPAILAASADDGLNLTTKLSEEVFFMHGSSQLKLSDNHLKAVNVRQDLALLSGFPQEVVSTRHHAHHINFCPATLLWVAAGGLATPLEEVPHADDSRVVNIKITGWLNIESEVLNPSNIEAVSSMMLITQLVNVLPVAERESALENFKMECKHWKQVCAVQGYDLFYLCCSGDLTVLPRLPRIGCPVAVPNGEIIGLLDVESKLLYSSITFHQIMSISFILNAPTTLQNEANSSVICGTQPTNFFTIAVQERVLWKLQIPVELLDQLQGRMLGFYSPDARSRIQIQASMLSGPEIVQGNVIDQADITSDVLNPSDRFSQHSLISCFAHVSMPITLIVNLAVEVGQERMVGQLQIARTAADSHHHLSMTQIGAVSSTLVSNRCVCTNIVVVSNGSSERMNIHYRGQIPPDIDVTEVPQLLMKPADLRNPVGNSVSLLDTGWETPRARQLCGQGERKLPDVSKASDDTTCCWERAESYELSALNFSNHTQPPNGDESELNLSSDNSKTPALSRIEANQNSSSIEKSDGQTSEMNTSTTVTIDTKKSYAATATQSLNRAKKGKESKHYPSNAAGKRAKNRKHTEFTFQGQEKVMSKVGVASDPFHAWNHCYPGTPLNRHTKPAKSLWTGSSRVGTVLKGLLELFGGCCSLTRPPELLMFLLLSYIISPVSASSSHSNPSWTDSVLAYLAQHYVIAGIISAIVLLSIVFVIVLCRRFTTEHDSDHPDGGIPSHCDTNSEMQNVANPCEEEGYQPRLESAISFAAPCGATVNHPVPFPCSNDVHAPTQESSTDTISFSDLNLSSSSRFLYSSENSSLMQPGMDSSSSAASELVQVDGQLVMPPRIVESGRARNYVGSDEEYQQKLHHHHSSHVFTVPFSKQHSLVESSIVTCGISSAVGFSSGDPSVALSVSPFCDEESGSSLVSNAAASTTSGVNVGYHSSLTSALVGLHCTSYHWQGQQSGSSSNSSFENDAVAHSHSDLHSNNDSDVNVQCGDLNATNCNAENFDEGLVFVGVNALQGVQVYEDKLPEPAEIVGGDCHEEEPKWSIFENSIKNFYSRLGDDEEY